MFRGLIYEQPAISCFTKAYCRGYSFFHQDHLHLEELSWQSKDYLDKCLQQLACACESARQNHLKKLEEDQID